MTLQLIPFIFMDGEAKEAIKFYEKSLDAKIIFTQTFGESPDLANDQLPTDIKDRLALSVLRIEDTDLFVADISPNQLDNLNGSKITICITTDDIEKSRRFFESLQQGGHVIIPLNQTHFSPAYGMVTDKFGVTFQIFTTNPQ